ncbi:MAG: hypothetical protein ACT4PL_07455, partial [Phycisphaerales bacterium]
VREVALPLSRPGVAGRLRNQSALFIDLHTAEADLLNVGSIDLWEGALANVRAARATAPAWPDQQQAAEVAWTLDMAEFAALRAVAHRGRAGISATQRGDLAARLRALTAELRRLWLLRSRPGGLDHSCGFLASLTRELGAGSPS